MVKNDKYWNADEIVANKITFVFMQNGAAAVAGIKDGTLDMAYEPPQQDIPTLSSEGLIQIKPLIATYYYPINVTNEYLKDPRVRKALSLAIDRNYIVENVTKGGQKPAGGWVPYEVSDIDGDFRVNGGNFYDISEGGYSNNIEMANSNFLLFLLSIYFKIYSISGNENISLNINRSYIILSLFIPFFDKINMPA